MLTKRLSAPALIGGVLLLAMPSSAATLVSPLTVASLTTPTLTENFDTLAATGSSAVLPTGWQIVETGTGAGVDGKYAASTGSLNTGSAYSYGIDGDRALGALTSGTASPIAFGLVFTNNLGSTITSLDIRYIGEQWRLANSTTSALTFQYKLGASTISDADAGWSDFAALDFASVVTGGTSSGAALNGNDAANQAAITGVLTGLSIADGASFAIRWRDLDASGSDNGLAIDNFSLTANSAAPVPEPASWAMLIGGFAMVGGAMRRRTRAIANA